MAVAKVVIDVAAAAIDSLFDYEIPENLEGSVQPGVRVVVPFGPRKVMGFVTELTSESDFESLKEIISVMDHIPVLTKELLDLSKWLQEETLCYRISAMQAMLPAAFKAKYKRKFGCWLTKMNFRIRGKSLQKDARYFPLKSWINIKYLQAKSLGWFKKDLLILNISSKEKIV